MKKLFLLIAVFCCALTVSANAQFSKPTLQSQLPQYFPDNTTNYISPALLRAWLSGAINSWQQYPGANAQTGTSYTVKTSDYGQFLSFTNSSSIAVSLPAGTTTAGFYPFSFYATNSGTGTVTITPQSGTIGGSGTLSLSTGTSALIYADGTNWQVVKGSGGGGGGGSPGGSTNAVQFNCTGSFCGTNIQNNGVVTTSNAALPQITTSLPNGITATTQATSDATTLIATDQYVQNVVASGVGAVSSVFTRTGAITAQNGDYTASQVTGALVNTNNLSDVSSAASARTNLGLGTLAVGNAATPPALGTVTPNSAAFSTLTTNGTTNIISGPFQFNGNTLTLPGSAATLAFQSGGWVVGDCLKVATGGNGAIADAGAACGSGSGGGGSTANTQDFIGGVNFTPGTTTTLTLSSSPFSSASVTITFDGVTQSHDSWSINLTTNVITFDAAIPLNVQVVEAQWLSTSLTGGTVTSVSVVSANGFAGSVANATTTPGITVSTTINGYLQGNGTALAVATANANTILGNWTGSTGNVIANAMSACADNGGNHLNYVSGTGITCGTSSSGITALTGDVTASGTGSVAATIAANAVTYAKMQQASTVTLLGNPTGGTHNLEEITLAGGTLNFSGTTLGCTTATTSQIGCSKPDGTSIAISAGVISVIGSPATSIAVGSTTISGGTNSDCLYDNAGVVGVQSCGTATSIAVGSTTVTSGTNNYLLTTGTGTLANVASITLAQTAAFTRAMNTIAAAQLAGPMGFAIGAL